MLYSLPLFKWLKKGNSLKTLILFLLLLLGHFKTFAEQLPNHKLWDVLLKKHVKTNGVDYENFLKDKKALEFYLKQFESISLKEFNEKEQLALFINAYNAFTVDLILSNYSNTLKSIKDIKNPWDNKIYNIAGTKYSLNEIEHKFLRENLKEPRIHFAINCASISCPPLQPYAFLPNQIESQLSDVTTKFINSPQGVRITENKIEISQIFNWFKKDFETEKTTLTNFISKFLNPSLDISKHKISYIEYNWNLNKTEK